LPVGVWAPAAEALKTATGATASSPDTIKARNMDSDPRLDLRK
jgi:hypothetical protein